MVEVYHNCIAFFIGMLLVSFFSYYLDTISKVIDGEICKDTYPKVWKLFIPFYTWAVSLAKAIKEY